MSLSKTRQAAVITAKDQSSGISLRCDLLITVIRRIEIVTTTKELMVDEQPERLHARAYDDYGRMSVCLSVCLSVCPSVCLSICQSMFLFLCHPSHQLYLTVLCLLLSDNMFTSLNGQVFEWTLLPYTGHNGSEVPEADPASIIRFVPFDDSTYDGREHDETRSLERKGLRGDQILAAGISTGMATIQARLTHNAWKNVPVHRVTIRVVENLMLQPSNEVYILVNSYVDFTVKRRRHGKTTVLPMPYSPYELSLTNTTVGSLNQSTSRVTGLAIGVTNIRIINRNVDTGGFTHVPTGTVHVVPPGRLGFDISGGNWNIEINKTYDITIKVYDWQNKLLSLTDNVRILAVFPDEYFDVVYSTINGSFHTVRPLKVAEVTLTGQLRGVVIEQSGEIHVFRPAVSGEQATEIYSSITVLPQLVVLPWDPQLSVHHDYQLEAVGGSGLYDWSIGRTSVGRMADGLVTVVGQGVAQPKANDGKNHAIFNTSQLFVVPPAEIKFLPSQVECLIGKTIDLPLSVKGLVQIDGKETLVLFDDCRRLLLDWEFTDKGTFQIVYHTEYSLSDLPNGSCAVIQVEALKQGHTQLTAVYNRPGIKLEAAVLIAGYSPLKLSLPTQPALVTLASSYLYQFEGGPLPWPLHISGFSREMKTEKESAIISNRVGERITAMHHYVVTCRQLGDQNFTLTVKNRPSAKNPFPVSATVHSRIYCRPPVSARLFPQLRPDLIDSCPSFNEENQVFHVTSNQQIALDLTVQDNEGQDFDNFTSLEWQWEMTVEGVVEFLENGALPNQNGNKAIQRVDIIGNGQSSVDISGTSNRYLINHLTQISIHENRSLSDPVRATLSLRMRANPVIVPGSLTLYNHPSNIAYLTVQNGSGFFMVSLSGNSPSDIVEYRHDQRLSKIKMIPLHDGQVTVIVQDLCLLSNEITATAVVYVSGIYRFDVQVVEKVQVGRSIVASVRVVDMWGNIFSSSQYKYMNLNAYALQPLLDFSNVSQEQFNSIPRDRHENSALFSVNGLIEGTTQIIFNATVPPDEIITSDPATIQVFSELRVEPQEVILIPTATFQILVTGGPRHDARIMYTSLNTTVCTVDSAGVITANSPGQTTVAVVSQSGEVRKVVHTEATVQVIVLKLTGVKISAPSSQLLIRTEISVYAIGRNDETPFSFASTVPGLKFHWSSSNGDLVLLHSVYDKAGFSLQTDPDFAVRLRTNKVGQSRVSLEVHCAPNACIPDQAVFTDALDVQVLESLQLVYPKNGHLLLPHNAHSQIRTNRDGNSQILYSICLPQNGQSTDTPSIHISASGQITTGSLDGESVVMVTSVEPYGFNQTVLVHVEVKPIHSLTINSLSDARASDLRLHAFPIGYNAPYSVLLHDAVGRLFDFSDVPIRHRMNRVDVMRVEMSAGNGSFFIKGIRIGQVILKMWIPGLSQINDYIRVRIGYALQPMPALIHQGSSICFTTHLYFENGVWSSSNVGVIQVDSQTGNAVAVASGSALISFTVEEIINTHIKVTVSTVQIVTLESPSQSLMSTRSGKSQSAFQVLVSFMANRGGQNFTSVMDKGAACADTGSKTYKQQIPFECVVFFESPGSYEHISLSDIFIVNPVFDETTGSSYCQFIPNSVDFTRATMISQTEGTVNVQAKAFDAGRNYEVVSETLSLSFVGAFMISHHLVELSDKKMDGDIAVSGTKRMLESLKVCDIVSDSLCSALQMDSGSLLGIIMFVEDEMNS
jgi:nuclear pore complex protein Nup210